MGEAGAVEEVEEEDPGREQMGRLRGEAGRGREVKGRDFAVELWVKTRCRSRRRPGEEEQRVLGGRRCSRSERWLPECWAAVLPSSGCGADSDAAGWTSESPGRDTAAWGVNERRSETRISLRSNRSGPWTSELSPV